MKCKKQLLVIFFAYFLVINESEAIFGSLFSLGTKLLPSVFKLFSRKKQRALMKRDLEDMMDPYQKNLKLDRYLRRLAMD
uniref:NDBP2 n=1 Tax=Lychas mucronatus TaxID=172552 RepID=A0A0U1TZL1_LYCMC|nr:NDBP2 [Lychas mucronatus]